jgi:hypothetical protein
MNRPFQRVGAVSNSHVGAAFEDVAARQFERCGITLRANFPVEIGLNGKKQHCFDLGSSRPRILVECKSHRWTKGDKVPSAKMTVWNEAMFYFHLAPASFRKVMFVLRDLRKSDGESLLAYYLRTYWHLIPKGVEFLEFDEKTGRTREFRCPTSRYSQPRFRRVNSGSPLQLERHLRGG